MAGGSVDFAGCAGGDDGLVRHAAVLAIGGFPDYSDRSCTCCGRSGFVACRADGILSRFPVCRAVPYPDMDVHITRNISAYIGAGEMAVAVRAQSDVGPYQ